MQMQQFKEVSGLMSVSDCKINVRLLGLVV